MNLLRKRAARKAFYLGLTGGIGSGKSTVGGMLRNAGAALIDADAIARAVTASGGSAIEALRTQFGAEYIQTDGAMDRERMRALVFGDPTAKQRLESIVHPLVGMNTWAAASNAEQQGYAVIAFDIPLLVESKYWPAQLDAVLVVDCLPETQITRVQARSGLAPDAIRAIMQAQSPRGARRAAADAVIYNEALSLTDLQTKTRQIAMQFGL